MVSTSLSENIFNPIPLKELSNKMKKRHDKWLPIVNDLFDEFMISNGDKFTSLNDIIIKEMEKELDIYTMTTEDYKNFQKELEDLDKRFAHVNEFISKLSPDEYKSMITSKYFRAAKILKKSAASLREDLLQKEVWNENDGLIYTYYVILSRVISNLVTKLEESSAEEGNKLIPTIGLVSLVYGSVVIAYLQDKLKPEVLIERLSELATFSNIPNIKTSTKVKKVLKRSRKVPVI
jgi:hypothetical protein